MSIEIGLLSCGLDELNEDLFKLIERIEEKTETGFEPV